MQVSLKAMSEGSFTEYLSSAISDYALANIKSGRWSESEAMEKSKEAHSLLLPDGLETENHHLFDIFENENGECVGHLWIELKGENHSKSAFVYSIGINERFRRKGYAKSALYCLEETALELGAKCVDLHVFGFNSAAQALYEHAGYHVVSQNMRKTIGIQHEQ
ncbi:GNAT family N-acetyltransferase [Grimontia marina]|uniref:Putative N-acetyltransferase YycN n=1 Tax=Grimontia marina TaxID=646534 RepID=A0A128FH60_9GAMM|nr:GNAT family N-acetyltransferase [Grimontia marina]CZF86143.1 putative N-acetyltransferase YycN [Grimontia marina]